MMNFLFGTVAGGIIACIITITAARHPEVQVRLGLVPPALAAPAPPPQRCPEPARSAAVTGAANGAALSRPDLLFSRKRFWNVAP